MSGSSDVHQLLESAKNISHLKNKSVILPEGVETVPYASNAIPIKETIIQGLKSVSKSKDLNLDELINKVKNSPNEDSIVADAMSGLVDIVQHQKTLAAALNTQDMVIQLNEKLDNFILEETNYKTSILSGIEDIRQRSKETKTKIVPQGIEDEKLVDVAEGMLSVLKLLYVKDSANSYVKWGANSIRDYYSHQKIKLISVMGEFGKSQDKSQGNFARIWKSHVKAP